VELQALTEADFVRILTEPEGSLTKQYQALAAAEGFALEYTDGAVTELARMARQANDRLENIGARRLHTVMATLMEDVLFSLPEWPDKTIVVDEAFVRQRLAAILGDDDLRRYIL
jgi:ATP-dependent HslUV protease ATP-binding subunit HslU